jgi:hypothetical protein
VIDKFELSREQGRRGLSLLGLVGFAIGAACLMGAGPVSRLSGLPEDRRSRWALRMFGVRELLLGVGLYHSAVRDDPEQARLFAGLLGLSQLGDLAVTTGMLVRGGASRRVGLAVWLGAPPTIALAELIRRAYGKAVPSV